MFEILVSKSLTPSRVLVPLIVNVSVPDILVTLVPDAFAPIIAPLSIDVIPEFPPVW